MADTTFLKTVVEPHVRSVLQQEFGVSFEAQEVALSTGATQEFNAVSGDRSIVAAIKSASGRTAGGKIPSGKIKTAEAELYYLSLAQARTRLLVLTNPEFYEIMSKRLEGRLAPGISLRLVELPQEMQAKVSALQKVASKEVSPSSPR